MATLLRKKAFHGGAHMNIKPKIISVSKGRQITLPVQFYRELGIDDEVECLLRDNEIVIRPVRRGDDFSEEILKDLVQQGYNGNELIEEFHRQRAGIRSAVKQMLHEVHQAAKNVNLSTSPEEQIAELFSDDGNKQKE